MQTLPPSLPPPAFPAAPSRLRVAGWVMLAAILLFVQDNVMFWLFADADRIWARTAVALLYYTLAGCLVWVAAQRVDPWLERRGAGFGARMAGGMGVLLAALVLLTALVYGVVFPLMLGRPVRPMGLYAIAFRVGAVALIVYGWLLFVRSTHGDRAQAIRLQAQADRLAASLDQAELAQLQAQIEPHFLFNTLALVKRQYRVQPAEAERLLATLIGYLESAAPALRSKQWTVGDELALVRLYFDIHVHRFGQRFRYVIAPAPAPWLAMPLPALVLATLAENAVRHGLAPKSGDGVIMVVLRHEAGALLMAVEDDGVGLRGSAGSGTGLSTVRARLRSTYGDAAEMLVEPRTPSGVRAQLRIPCGDSACAPAMQLEREEA